METLTDVMKDTEQTKYDRAKKKVDAIKGFYKHLRAYVIVNLIILIIKINIVNYISGGDLDTINFHKMLDWNVYLTPALWGIGLAMHGIYVFHGKIKFIKSWEERKINEIIEKEDSDGEKFK